MNTKKIRVLLCAAVVAFCAAGVGAAEPTELQMKLREIRTVAFESDIVSADPDSTRLDVTSVGARHLKLTAREPGTVSVAYRLQDGSSGVLRVVISGGTPNSQLEAVAAYLSSQLQTVIGIDTIEANEQLNVVVITGNIRVFKDWQYFQKVLQDTQQHLDYKVMSNVRFSPDLGSIQKQLEEILASSVGIQNARVKATAGGAGDLRLMLSGTAFTDEDIALAETAAKTVAEELDLGKTAIINGITKTDSIIEVEYTYFSLSDNLSRDTGFDLMNEINLRPSVGASWKTGEKPTYTADVGMDMTKVLKMLAADGYATISQTQTVKVESGKLGKAQFGGEVIIRPQATAAGTQAATEHIPYGFIIDVTPTLRPDNRVRMDMDIEKSSVAADGSDYRKTKSSTTTTVEAPLNSFSVLAVSSEDVGDEGNSGTPLLRKIPVVNWFFGKDTKMNNTAYSGFVVVPRISGTSRQATSPAVSARTDEVMNTIRAKLKHQKR